MPPEIEINAYGRELSQEELSRGDHRDLVGGMWAEVGQLQFNFLVEQGLQPCHYLLDVGCGSLRGGLHFVRYLDDSHYCGIDINESLLEGGRLELKNASLENKLPQLARTDSFDASSFGLRFDYVLAQSLFTHLPFNHIVRCMIEVRKVLNTGSPFFATFLEAPRPGCIEDIERMEGIVTHYDRDPYHQSFEELAMLANVAGLNTNLIGDWNHPRGQQMARFSV